MVAQLVQRPQEGSAAIERGDNVEPDASVRLVDGRGLEFGAELPVKDLDRVVAASGVLEPGPESVRRVLRDPVEAPWLLLCGRRLGRFRWRAGQHALEALEHAPRIASDRHTNFGAVRHGCGRFAVHTIDAAVDVGGDARHPPSQARRRSPTPNEPMRRRITGSQGTPRRPARAGRARRAGRQQPVRSGGARVPRL